jgi:hypothetical protein
MEPFGSGEFHDWFVYPAPVGMEHEFLLLEQWPHDTISIERNFFVVNEAFPTTKRHLGQQGRCGCSRRCQRTSLKGAHGCINAATDTICDDTNCSAGAGCGNRFVPTYHLQLIMTTVGYGVVTEEGIPSGSFIVEYVGELLFAAEAAKRRDKRYQVKMKNKTCWNAQLFVDAGRCGNISRFVNHSCQPNCELYEFVWANTSRLGIFAERDIAPLTELTFKYNEDNLELFMCVCGSSNCVSFINIKQ